MVDQQVDNNTDNNTNQVDGSQNQQQVDFNKPLGEQGISLDLYDMLSQGLDFNTIQQAEASYGANAIVFPREEVFNQMLTANPALKDYPDVMEKSYQGLIAAKSMYDQYKEEVGEKFSEGFPEQFIGTNVSEAGVGSIYNDGKKTAVIDPQEIASSLGYVQSKEGDWVPYNDKDKLDNKLKLMSNRSNDGNPELYWKEADDHEYISGVNMLSAFGPRSIYTESAWSSIGRGGVAGSFPIVFKGLGSMVEAVGDALMPGSDEKLTDYAGHWLMNTGNYYTGQNVDEAQNPFGNFNSFLWNVSNGVTQVGGIIIAGGIVGGTTSLLGGGARLAGKAGEAAGLLLGASEGGSGVYEEMKDLGFGDREAALWYFAFSAGTLASEMVLSANVIQRGYGRQMRSYMGRFMKESTDGIADIAKVSGNKVAAAKRVWYSKWQHELREFADKNAATRIVVGSGEEGIEELIEGGIHYGLMNLANGVKHMAAERYVNDYKGVKFEKIDHDKMGLKKTEAGGIGEGLMYGGSFYSTDKKYLMTTKDGETFAMTYDEYKEIQDNLFKSKSILNDNGLFHPEFNMSEAGIAAISTALTLGMVAANPSSGIRNKRIQDFNEAQQAFEEDKRPNKQKKFDKGLQDWVTQNSGYLSGQTSDGVATDDVSKSAAADMATAVRDRIDAYKNIIKQNDLSNSEALKAMGGDRIAKGLIVDIKSATDIRVAIDNAQDNEAISYNDKTYTAEELETKHKEITESINDRTVITEFGTSEYMRRHQVFFNMQFDLSEGNKMAWLDKPMFAEAYFAIYNKNNFMISKMFGDEAVDGKFNLSTLFSDEFTSLTSAAGLSTLQDLGMMKPGKESFADFENLVNNQTKVLTELHANMESTRTLDGKISTDIKFGAASSDYTSALKQIKSAVDNLKQGVGINYSEGSFDMGLDDKREQQKRKEVGTETQKSLVELFSLGNEIDALSTQLKEEKSKPKGKSKSTGSKSSRIAEALMPGIVDDVNDIRKKYKGDKKSLSEPGNSETLQSAMMAIEELDIFLKLKESANKTDGTRATVIKEDGRGGDSEETFGYQTNGSTLTLGNQSTVIDGNQLSQKEIDDVRSILNDLTNGKDDGDLSINEMGKILGFDVASLKTRERSARLINVKNQIKFLKKYIKYDFFHGATLTAIEELSDDINNFSSELTNDAVITFESELSRIKTKMHFEMQANKTGAKSLMAEILVDLSKNFNDAIGEKYNYSKNTDGITLSENEINSGRIVIEGKLHTFNIGNPFAFLVSLKDEGKVKSENIKRLYDTIARNIADKSISRHVLLLNELMYLNNEQFYKSYRDVTNSYKFADNDRFLSIQQEEAVKTAFMDYSRNGELVGLFSSVGNSASQESIWKTVLKNIGLESNVAKDLYNVGGLLSEVQLSPQMNGTFIQGTGGAGKTTFVLKTLMSMVNDHIENDNGIKRNVIFVGPNKQNTNKMKANVGNQSMLATDAEFTIPEFIQSLSTINITNDTVIVIDEASLLYMNDVSMLKKHLKDNNISPTIFALADPQQPKYDSSGVDNSTGIQIDDFFFRTNLISEVHRTGIPMIAELQASIGNSMIGVNKELNKIQYPAYMAHNSSHTKGIMLISKNLGAKAIQKQFLKDMNDKPSSDRVIIFSNEAARDSFLKKNDSIPKEQALFIEPKNPQHGNDSAQGLEYKYVYVALPLDTSLHGLRLLKTAVGRSKKFVVMLGESNKSKINNNIVDVSDTDSEHATINDKNDQELFTDQNNRISQLSMGVAEAVKTDTKTTTKSQPLTAGVQDTAQDDVSDTDELIEEAETIEDDNSIEQDEVIIPEEDLSIVIDELNDFIGGDLETTIFRFGAIHNLYRFADVTRSPDTNKVMYVFVNPKNETWVETDIKRIKDSIHGKEIEVGTDKLNPIDDESYMYTLLANNDELFSAGILPFSIAYIPVTNGITDLVSKYNLENAYAQLLKQRVGAEVRSIKLVYHDKKDLYDLNTGRIKENYNVIVVENQSGTALGVLYQPLNNDTEIDSWVGGMRKSDKKLSKENYNPDNVEHGTAGHNYSVALNKLYQAGMDAFASNKKRTKNGGVVFHESASGVSHNILHNPENSVVYDFNNPISTTEFVNTMMDNGGAVMNANGVVARKGQDIFIKQMLDQNDKVSDVIYVKRVDDPQFPWIPVEIKGQSILSLNDGASKKLNSENKRDLSLLTKLAKKADSKKGTKVDQATAFKDFTTAMNNSFMMQTLLYNRSSIIAEGGISTRLLNYLYMRDGFIDVKKTGNVSSIVENLKKAYDIVLSDRAYFPSIKSGVITGEKKNTISLSSTVEQGFYGNTTTFAQSVNSAVSMIENFQPIGNDIGSGLKNDISLLPATKNSNERKYNPVEIEKAVSYLTTVFGEDFVNDVLEFKSSIIVKEKAAYGAVGLMEMFIETVDNTVQNNIGQHEAVHYALRHFVAAPSYNKILNDAKAIMRAKGLKTFVSDYQANEFIAEVNEGLHTIEPTTILGKFISWFKNVYNYIIGNRDTVNNFLQDINSGVYRSMDAEYNNGTTMQPMHKPSVYDENLSPEDLLIKRIFGVTERSGPMSKLEMADVVEGDHNLNDTMQMFKFFLKNENPSRTSIGDNNTFDVKDYHKVIVNGLRSFVNQTPEHIKGKEITFETKASERYMLLAAMVVNNRDFIESGILTVRPEVNLNEMAVDATNESNWDDNSNTSVSSKMSSVLKYELETIASHDFSIKRDKKKPTAVSLIPGTQKRMSLSKLTRLISDNFKNHRVNVNSSTDPATSFFEMLYNKALKNESLEHNEHSNLILSFLLDIGYLNIDSNGKLAKGLPSVINSTTKLRPYHYYKYQQDILTDMGYVSSQQKMKGLESEASVASVIKVKAEYGNDIVNSFMSLFSSAQELDVIGVEAKKPNNESMFFQSIKKYVTNANEMKRIFMNSMINKFYTEEGKRDSLESLVMPPRSLGNVRKPNNSLMVQDDNIFFYLNSEKSIKIMTYNPLSKKWIWNHAEFTGAKGTVMLDKVLKFFAIKTSMATKRALLGVDYSSTYNIDDLANGIGAIATTLRSYFETDPVDNKYSKRVNDFIKKDKLKPISLSERQNDNDTDEDVENIPGLHIETFFDYIGKLASVETELNVIIRRSYAYTPEGKAVHLSALGSYLSRLLTSDENQPADQSLVNEFNNTLNSMTDDEKRLNPIIELNEDGSETILEPLLNGGIKVTALEYSSGIFNKYQPKDIKNLTSIDMYNHVVFGHFLTSMIRSSNDQLLKLPTLSLSDSGQFPIFTVKFSDGVTDNMFDVVKDGNTITNVTFNNDRMGKIFDDKFKVYFKKMKISLGKWTAYDVETGIYNEDIAKKNSIFKLSPENLKSLSNENDVVLRAEMLRNFVNTNLRGNGKMNNSNINKQKLSIAGMVENVDFKIEGNSLQLGANASMNYDTRIKAKGYVTSSPFTMSNYKAWSKLMNQKPSEAKTNDIGLFVDMIMNDRMSLFRNHMKKNTNIESEAINISNDWGNRISRKLDEPKTFKLDGLSHKNYWEFNPVYKAFVYSHFLFNDSITNTLLANEFQADDSRKLSKAGKALIAQGYVPNVDNFSNPIMTLGKDFNVVRVLDDVGKSKHYKDMFGLSDSYESTDGLMITNRLFTHFLQKSYGGDISYMKANDNTLKTIASGMDMKTMTGQYKKSSNMTLNDDIYNHNKEAFNNLQKYLLSGNLSNTNFNDIDDNNNNLWEVYEGYFEQTNSPSKAMKMVADYVINIRLSYGVDLLQGTIARVEFKSTAKFYSQNMNYMSLDDALAGKKQVLIDKQKTEDELFVLNANQDIYDHNVTDLSQIKLISSIDSSVGKKISDIDAILTNRKFDSIKKTFGNYVYDTFEESFRNLGNNVVGQIKGASALSDLLNIPEISIQLPTIIGKLWPSFTQKLNSAIDVKVTGSKMVQEPGDRFIHYYNIETAEGLVRATDEDIANGLYKIKKGTTKTAMDHTLISSSLEMITPAEVAIPFFWSNEFGINQDDKHSLNSILNFKLNGKNINLRAYLKSVVAEYYTDKNAVREALNEFMKKNYSKFDDKSFFKQNISDEITIENSEDLANYYWAFIQSLDVFAARIPSTSKGLAFSGEVASFTYDSGTTIYVNSSKILLDDSDYDIDQLTVLFRKINNNKGIVTVDEVEGNSLSSQSDNALANEKFNLLYNDWINYDQKDHLFVTLNTDKAVARAEKNMVGEAMLNHDFPSTVKNFIASHTGKRMVAVFANMIHVYTKLNQLSAKDRGTHLGKQLEFNDKGEISYEGNIELIIQTLGEMLQISVDNPKLMILDMLNINTESGAFIGALAMSGKTREEIYNILETEDVKTMFKKALDDKSVGSVKYNAIEHVENSIRSIENEDELIISEMRTAELASAQRQLDKFRELKVDGMKFVNLFDEENVDDSISLDLIKNLLSDTKKAKSFNKLSKSIKDSEGTIAEHTEVVLSEMIEDGRIIEKGDKYTLKENGVDKVFSDTEIRNVIRTRYLVDSRTFLRDAGKLIVGIDKKIDDVTARIEMLQDEEAFIEARRKSSEEQLKHLREVYDHMITGEAIKRVVPIFRLNKELPSSLYDLYNFTENIEFATGVSLDNLINNKAKNTYDWTVMDNYRKKTELGKEWNGATQATINTYARQFVSKLSDKLADSDIKNISVVLTAESGFNEAFALAFAEAGFNTTVTHESGNRFKNAAKYNVYDNKSGNVSVSADRYTDVNDRSNFTQTHTEKKGQMSLWHDITKTDKLGKRVEAVDAQLILNPFNQGMLDKMHNIRIAKSINAKEGVLENNDESIDELVNDLFLQLEEANKSNTILGKDGELTLGVLGTDIGSVNTKRLSEYQKWNEREQEVRSVFPDLPGMINKFSNIKSYIKIIGYLNQQKEHFSWHNETAQSLESKYLFAQKKNRFNSQKEYFGFQSQMQQAVLDQYFKDLTDPDLINIDLTRFNGARVAGAYGVNMVSDNATEATIAKHIDIRQYMQSLYFVLEFPSYVEAIQNEQMHYSNGAPNLFIENLIIDNGSLLIKNHNTLTDSEQSTMANEFKKLDEKTKKHFYAYNLLRNGFNMGGYYSLTNFIGSFMANDIGKSIESILGAGDNPASISFGNKMSENFIDNAIPNDPSLYNYFSKNAKSKFEPPTYTQSYHTYRTDQLTGRKHQKAVPSAYLETEPNGNPLYAEVYNQLSKYQKRLPVAHLTTSFDEVVKLGDVQYLRDWFDFGKVRINYDFGHGFSGLQGEVDKVKSNYIRVNTGFAKMGYSTENVLNLTKTDKAEYDVTALNKSLPEPVASKIIERLSGNNSTNIKVKSMTKNMLRDLVKILSPFVEVSVVNNDTTSHQGLKGYIQNGQLFINEDLVTMDTLFHEIGHIFLWGNPNTEIMDIARAELDNETDFAMVIKDNYPGLDYNALVFEIGATMIGLSSQSKIDAFMSGKGKSFISSVLKIVKDFWNNAKSIVNDIFGTNITIDTEDPIDVVVGKLMNDVKNGKWSATGAEIRLLENKYEAAMTASVQIKDISGLGDLLLIKDTKKSVEQYTLEIHARSLWNKTKNRISNGKSGIVRVGEKEWNLSEYVEDGRDNEAIDILTNEYLPLLYDEGTRIKKSFVNWLSNSASGGQANENNISSKFKLGGKEKTSAFRGSLLKLAEIIGWNKQSALMTISELSKMYPEFENAIPKDMDPNLLIAVHRAERDPAGVLTSIDLSIVKDIPYKVNFGNVGISGKLISSNYMTDAEGSKNGISMKASQANVEKLKVMMFAMMLKSKLGDSVNIRSLGISEMDDGNAKVTYSPINMVISLSNLKALSRSAQFLNDIPSSMSNLLKSPSVFDINSYSQNYYESLLSMFNSSSQNTPASGSMSNDIIGQLEGVIAGSGSIKQLQKTLRLYKHILQRKLDSSITKDDVSYEEYRMISLALFEMNTKTNMTKRNMNEVGLYSFYLMNQADQGNRIIQSFYSTMRNELNIISGLFAVEQDKLAEETKKIMEIHKRTDKKQKYMEWTVDMSENYFDKFFIYKTINGKRVNTFTIHHDKNNPDTRRALADRTLSTEEFEYSQFIADKVEDMMKKLLHAKFKYSYPVFKNGEFNEAKLTQMVEDYYASHWEKGRMPLMRKAVSTFLKEGKLREATRKFIYQASNPERIFQDVLEIDIDNTETEQVSSIFLSQVGGYGSNVFGSNKRMEQIGIEEIDGEVKTLDNNDNERWTLNLFNIAKYITMDGISKPILEDRLIPAYREAKIAANTMSIFSNENKGQTEKHLRVLFEKNILGKHQKEFGENKAWDTVSGSVRMMIKLTTFNGVALSLPVAVTSLTANTFEAITSSIATNISGRNPYNIFGITEWGSAIKEYSTNHKKVAAIMSYYQVIESDRWDLLINPKYDVTFKSPWHSNAAHFMNRWTDISARAIAAVAQMKFEGTWDSHSLDENGNVVYDSSKDKRFSNYKSNKKQNELRNWLTENLSEDERTSEEQKGKTAPTRAYDVDDQRKLEHVGSQFIVGVYNKEATTIGDSYLFVNVLLQFKKFMVTKTAERLGHKIDASEGGWKVINEDQKGDMVRAWKSYEKEGSWVTASKILIKSTPFLAILLSKADWVNETHTLAQWGKMTDLERYNLTRTALDLIFIATAYVGYTGIQALAGGDDDLEWTMRYQRIMRAFKEGMQTAYLTAPQEMFDMFTGLPIIDTARRLINMILFRDPLKNASYLMPGGGTKKVVSEIINDTNN